MTIDRTTTYTVRVSKQIERIAGHQSKFLSFLPTRVENRAAAEDILQSAYLRAVDHGSENRDGHGDEDGRHHSGQERPARDRQSKAAESAHQIQHSREPVLRVLLQPARGSTGGWSSVSILRTAAEPDDRCRRHERPMQSPQSQVSPVAMRI